MDFMDEITNSDSDSSLSSNECEIAPFCEGYVWTVTVPHHDIFVSRDISNHDSIMSSSNENSEVSPYENLTCFRLYSIY